MGTHALQGFQVKASPDILINKEISVSILLHQLWTWWGGSDRFPNLQACMSLSTVTGLCNMWISNTQEGQGSIRKICKIFLFFMPIQRIVTSFDLLINRQWKIVWVKINISPQTLFLRCSQRQLRCVCNEQYAYLLVYVDKNSINLAFFSNNAKCSIIIPDRVMFVYFPKVSHTSWKHGSDLHSIRNAIWELSADADCNDFKAIILLTDTSHLLKV